MSKLWHLPISVWKLPSLRCPAFRNINILKWMFDRVDTGKKLISIGYETFCSKESRPEKVVKEIQYFSLNSNLHWIWRQNVFN